MKSSIEYVYYNKRRGSIYILRSTFEHGGATYCLLEAIYEDDDHVCALEMDVERIYTVECASVPKARGGSYEYGGEEFTVRDFAFDGYGRLLLAVEDSNGRLSVKIGSEDKINQSRKAVS